MESWLCVLRGQKKQECRLWGMKCGVLLVVLAVLLLLLLMAPPRACCFKNGPGGRASEGVGKEGLTFTPLIHGQREVAQGAQHPLGSVPHLGGPWGAVGAAPALGCSLCLQPGEGVEDSWTVGAQGALSGKPGLSVASDIQP